MTNVSENLPLCHKWVRIPGLPPTSSKILLMALDISGPQCSHCQDLRSSPKLLFIFSKTNPSTHPSLQAVVLSCPRSFISSGAGFSPGLEKKTALESFSLLQTRQGTSLPVSGEVPTAAACTHYRNILLPSPSGGPTQGPSQIWSSAVGNDIRTGSRMAARHDT